MSEEQKASGAEQKPSGKPMAEEMKVQAQDLFKTINDIIREGSARRVTVMRQDRVLLDIPLTAGVAVSVVMAIWAPFISAVALVGALLGGFTVRVERQGPKGEA
jgi:hypothetical protein